MQKLFFLLPVFILFAACQKELSFEGGGITTSGSSSGTAVYRLSGAGSSCTGFTLSGVYQAGTVMVTSDSVVLQVTVDTIGTYSLSTNTTNGITFTSSGTFTKTGIQTITLIATGTPIAAGSFVYTPPVGAGCSFNVTVIAGTTTTNSNYTWQFTYNGKTFSGPITASKDSTLATGGELLALYGVGITTTNGLKDSTAFGLSLVNIFGKITPASYPTNVNLANLGTSVTKLCLQWAYGFAYEGNNSGNYDSVYLALPTVANMNVTVTNYSTSSNIIQGTFSGTANNGSTTKDSLVTITNGSFSSKIY